MKVALCVLAFGAVVAQPDATSDSSGDSAWTTTSSNSGSSGTESYNDAGYSGGSNWGSWGSVGGSGSGWDWGWDGDAGWDPSKELWHFRPSWNWDSPYPPEGTMYVENWGTPPTLEIPSRRSFYFGANQSVSLVGATAEDGRADCGWRDWCVHLTFHSSYGVLSDFDAFVLDRYDSAERLYGDGFWNAREGNDEPRVFAPLVLGGFSPEERASLRNISTWKVEEMARRFNETRTTTWTLYPESDEMDVILSFKQLYTLLPGYPDGNITNSEMNRGVINEWGAGDQVLLRVIAKREGSGATSVMMPRVLNFTGSQLFQVESYSSLEYPQDAGKNLSAAPNAMTLDVVFNRRRYGSGLPWNPARPSDVCDACNQQVMNHPTIARCLHGHIPEKIFQNIYELSANEQMEWDRGEWAVDDMGPSNSSFNLDDVVDACFGLRWLLNGKLDDGSWSTDPPGFPNAGDRRSSSGSGFGDAGYGWTGRGSGSGGYRYNDAPRSSEFREPVYRYDDSGSRWSSWGYRDVGSESNYGDAGGSRWSSSGSPGGPNVGDWPSVGDLGTALAIARETDTGIQCFVEARCPVGTRNFAEAAGRMVVLEHSRAVVRVNFLDPKYRFYIWMGLDGLGSDGQFTTPELSSDHTPEEMAELIAAAVPNASEYCLAFDVRVFNNSEVIDWVKTYNDWIKNYYNSGGSEPEASAAWASHTAASNGDQYPPVGGGSDGYYHNVGQGSDGSDGSAPDVGQGSDSSWFADPFPESEPQFTVEISLRNVSVVPSIVDVFVVGDDPTDSSSSNMTWSTRGSELRFQLSPLNLSTFEYVPPPSYVNLTWNEDMPEYPDPNGNGSSVDDSGIWHICAQCADPYYSCGNSTSCKIGVRAYMQEALSPSRLEPYEVSDNMDIYSRKFWGVDFGPHIRQAASFFTADGYYHFMNLMTCLSRCACDLDLPRQVYSHTRGEYQPAEPTLLKLVHAESVFAISTTTTGEAENILMKYRGKEHLFEWNGLYKGSQNPLRDFIIDVMSEHNADESAWRQNPTYTTWVEVWDVEQYPGTRVFNVTFVNNYFIECDPPQFKPTTSGEYNELNSSNWKAIVGAYRNQKDESLWDNYPTVTWRKLSNWMYDLGGDPNYLAGFINNNTRPEDIPICHQCMDAWAQCVSNQLCADAMRQELLPLLSDSLRTTMPRSSIDFTATLRLWRKSTEDQKYRKVMKFLSCLSAESCPIGYARPSDPVASLVPVTMTLMTHYAVTLPMGQEIVATLNEFQLELDSHLTTSITDLKNWSRAAANYESDVDVQVYVNGTSLHYDVSYYPAVTEIPVFYIKDSKTVYEAAIRKTFAFFQLSSNLVRYGQVVSADLLNYWFGISSNSRKLFYYAGDIFSGSRICDGCPECLEAVTRCRNDMDCAISTRDVLVPLLRNTKLPLSTSTQNDGDALVKLELSSLLLSVENKAFLSREGWLAFAHMLRAMSSCGCEVGFGQWSSDRDYIEPTRLHIDSEVVELTVRLYPTSQLDVLLNGNVFSYTSDGASSPMDSANKFSGWLKTTLDPSHLSVTVKDITIDDVSGTAIVTINMYGPYDKASNSQPLVNPTWIPTFIVKSNPPAEVTVTPWKITLQSVNRYPPFDRLLDLLEYGAVSDDTPSSNSTITSGSFTGDACGMCATQRQACFDDKECSAAISDQLLSILDTMGSVGKPDIGYFFDVSNQILDGIFSKMQAVKAKQKLLALLTCSATKWATTGTSCIQHLSDANYPGVPSYLEVTNAKSVFPINKGKGANVYSLSGIPYYYTDNGNPVELTDFMENKVLGGYELSGVKVEATSDWASETYTVIYQGLTALSLPRIEYTDTISSPMQFIFWCSDPDLAPKFKPWRKWLDPSNA